MSKIVVCFANEISWNRQAKGKASKHVHKWKPASSKDWQGLNVQLCNLHRICFCCWVLWSFPLQLPNASLLGFHQSLDESRKTTYLNRPGQWVRGIRFPGFFYTQLIHSAPKREHMIYSLDSRSHLQLITDNSYFELREGAADSVRQIEPTAPSFYSWSRQIAISFNTYEMPALVFPQLPQRISPPPHFCPSVHFWYGNGKLMNHQFERPLYPVSLLWTSAIDLSQLPAEMRTRPMHL